MNKFTENTLERELISRDSEFTSFFDSLGKEDRRFVRKKISHYPRKVQGIIIGLYRKEKTPFDANTALRKLTENLDSIIPPVLLNHFDAGEHEFREVADNMAEQCRNYEIRENRVYSFAVANTKLSKQKCLSESESNSVNGLNPVNNSRSNTKVIGIYLWCTNFVNGKGLKAPEVNTKQTIEGASNGCKIEGGGLGGCAD